MKVYRSSFEKALSKLPSLDVASNIHRAFVDQPVHIFSDRTFLPEQPHHTPFVRFRKNHISKSWELIDEVELIDE